MAEPVTSERALHAADNEQRFDARITRHKHIIKDIRDSENWEDNMNFFSYYRPGNPDPGSDGHDVIKYIKSTALERDNIQFENPRPSDFLWGSILNAALVHYNYAKGSMDYAVRQLRGMSHGDRHYRQILVTPQPQVPLHLPDQYRAHPSFIVEGLRRVSSHSEGYRLQEEMYQWLSHAYPHSTVPEPCNFQLTPIIVVHTEKTGVSKEALFRESHRSASLALQDRPMREPSQKSCFCIAHSGSYLFTFEFYRSDHPRYEHISHRNFHNVDGRETFPGFVPIFPRGISEQGMKNFFEAAPDDEYARGGFNIARHDRFLHRVFLYMFIKQSPDGAGFSEDVYKGTFTFV